MRRIARLAVVLSLLAFAGGPKEADAAPFLEFHPVAEGGVFDNASSSGVFDGIADVVVGHLAIPARHVASTQGHGVIEFDTRSLGTAQIEQAFLDIIPRGLLIRLDSPTVTVELYAYEGDGTLGLTDFGRGSLLTTFTVSSALLASVMSIDVTDFLKLDHDIHAFNLRVNPIPSNLGLGVDFASKNFPPGPVLRVAAVPEPPALVLITAGLIALCVLQVARAIHRAGLRHSN